ncbi:hypothetical protein RKD26_005230 [Streptomyces calvus]
MLRIIRTGTGSVVTWRRAQGRIRGGRTRSRPLRGRVRPARPPAPPGRQWAERGGRHRGSDREPRRRRRATRTRPHGVRHLFAAYDLAEDQLHGHIEKTRSRSTFLEFCRCPRSPHRREARVAIVCDTYSPHLTTKRCRRVATWANAA